MNRRTDWNWICEDQVKGNNQLLPTVDKFDNCFIESTAQYKNLYVQIATSYAQRINTDKNCGQILDKNSLARRILLIASHKIENIEKHKGGHPILVKAIGELASQFIDLSLKHSKTEGLLELFNEALNQILRSDNSDCAQPKLPEPKIQTKTPIEKCILEHWEEALEDSSSSERSSSERKVAHLTDWSGDDNSEKGTLSDSKPTWIWSERL